MGRRIDIMTDIETLGKGDKSLVFQIAACAFDIATGEIIESFNKVANIKKEKNLCIDGDTLLWWLDTDKELLSKLLLGKTDYRMSDSSGNLIVEFNTWIQHIQSVRMSSKEEVFLWGNGVLFDNRLLKSKMEQIELEYPIFYRNDRDMRTIVELAALKTGAKTEKELRELNYDKKYTAHDGFDDVKQQIDILSKAWNLLLEK